MVTFLTNGCQHKNLTIHKARFYAYDNVLTNRHHRNAYQLHTACYGFLLWFLLIIRIIDASWNEKISRTLS